MTSDPRLSIGGNAPPSNAELLAEVLEALPDTLIDTNQKLNKRVIDLHIAAERMPAEIEDQDTADKATNFITLIQACRTLTEKTRKETKDPFLKASKEIDSFFGEMYDGLDTLQKTVLKPLDVWNKKKRDEEAAIIRAQEEKARKEAQARADEAARIETEARLKREAADKLARDAKNAEDAKIAKAAQEQAAREQAEADKKMVSAVKMESRADKLDNIATTGQGIGSTRTETGAMNILVKTWKGRWADSDAPAYTAADAADLWKYVPAAARETALNGLVREYAAAMKLNPNIAMPKIAGAVIEEIEETRVRK